MENEIKFVDGLFAKRKNNAPDFVIANLSFNEKIIDWLRDNFNAQGWCNVDLLVNKDGKIYAKKDEWKPNAEQTNTGVSNNQVEQTLNIPGEEITDEINIDNIPF